jgi:Family of unknown function (DUF6516)
MNFVRDKSLDTLLDLNGEVILIGDGAYWTKFVVKRVPVSKERPHGLHYSLTLHNTNGERVLGFDNAHAVQERSGPGARMQREHDHRHLREAVRYYKYTDAGTLMTDFWTAVFDYLREEN